MLKVSNVRALCSATTYSEGKNLCRPENLRKVKQIPVDTGSARAQGLVRGNFGYFHQVNLTLTWSKNNILSGYSCDCYEQTQLRTPCRHCIALALSLAEDDFVIADAADTSPEAPVSQPGVSEQQFRAPQEQADAVQDTDIRGMEILLGNDLKKTDGEGNPLPLYWTPNDTKRVFHTNTGIIGTMGTGKTQFTKSLVTQLYRQQKNNFNGAPLGILIFDYKGDYNSSKQDFIRATNARVFQPWQLPFNPLAIVKGKNFKPRLPVHVANAFKDTLSKVYRLGPKQQMTLVSCIMEAYHQCGIIPEDPATWSKPAPTFEMVNDIYEKNEELSKNDTLAVVMQKLSIVQLFEKNPCNAVSLYDLLKGVVVMDLSGYDPDIQNLTVAITLDLFYAQMHAHGASATDGNLRCLTKMILVDEADNFMREDFASLKKIMKEGREFGVGMILSTQCLDHFLTGEDNYSRYIMTWMIHNVSDLKKSEVEYIFKVQANSNEASEIYQSIKSCDRFQSAVKIGNEDICWIRDKAFFELDL